MPDYIDAPIDTNVQASLERAYAFMQAVFPGWQPHPAEPDVNMLMSYLFAVAELRDTASKVPTSIFRYLGASLLQLPTIDATQAHTTITFTAVDNAGHTIPGGTQVGILDANNVLVGFYTFNDAVIPPGSTSVSGVEVLASIPGAAGTGLGGVGTSGTLLDPLSYLQQSITVEAVTVGGVDAETDPDFLNRLAGALRLLSPRPILPPDFAALALNIEGNYRAAAIDGYDPLEATFNNEKMVALALIDINGDPRDSTAKDETSDYLESLREINFVVPTLDATYTDIDVVYTAKAVEGFDTDEAKANCDVAINGYLDKATWGNRPRDSRAWDTIRIVRYNELMHRISNVPGIDYVLTLALGVAGTTLGSADAQLTGIAPLPRVGTITGDVV